MIKKFEDKNYLVDGLYIEDFEKFKNKINEIIDKVNDLDFHVSRILRAMTHPCSTNEKGAYEKHKEIENYFVDSTFAKDATIETFDFCEALKRMKQGKKVRINYWDSGDYIYIKNDKIIDECNKEFIVHTQAVFSHDWMEF